MLQRAHPLLLPLLVDEVLLGHGDAALKWMNHLLPSNWQVAAGYIGLMLALTLCLRLAALAFNVISRPSCLPGWPRISSTACASA